MRILDLEFVAFGPFSNCGLNFGPARGLHILYGPNEAGKSSALRGLSQLLFGIPRNTDDDFRHPKDQLAIRARLADPDGATVEILRRKKDKNPLLDASTNQPIEQVDFERRFLPGVSKVHFEKMFAINQFELRQGGAEMARGEGDLGQLLFAGAAGLAHLHDVRKSLQEEMERLFVPRGTTREIGKLLTSISDARARFKSAGLPTREFVQQESELQSTRLEIEQCRAKLNDIRMTSARLEALERARREVATIAELEGKLDAMKDVPILPADFSQKREDLFRERHGAEQSLKKISARRRELQLELDGLTAPDPLLEKKDHIVEFHRKLDRFSEFEKEIAGSLARELATVREAITGHIHDLGLTVPQGEGLDAVERAIQKSRLTLADGKHFEELCGRYEQLSREQGQSKGYIKNAEEERKELADRLHSLGAARDVGPLRQKLEEIKAEGMLASKRQELAKRIDKSRAELEKTCARLPFWRGTPAELAAIPLPLGESVEQFDQQIRELQNRRRELSKKGKEIQSHIAELTRERQRIERDGPIVTDQELEDARRRRDELWREAKGRWRTEQPYAEDLVGEVERAVAQSDEFADTLREEASRLEQFAHIRSELERRLAEEANLKEELQLVDAEWTELWQRWRQAWQPVEIGEQTPVEMRAWLTTAQDLRRQFDQLSELETELSSLDTKMATYAQELGHHLAAFDGSEPADKSLSSRIQRASGLVDAAKDREAVRAELEKQLKKLDQNIARETAKLKESDSALAQWRMEWRQLTERLHLRPDAGVAEARAQNTGLASLFQALKRAKDLEDQLREKRRFVAEYRAEVEMLLREAAPELANEPIPATISRLFSRVTEAAKREQTRSSLLKDLESSETELIETNDRLERTHGELLELCRLAEVNEINRLQAQEELSRQKANLLDKLDGAKARLNQEAQNRPRDEFLKEAMSCDADEIEARLKELADEERRLRDEDSALHQKLGALVKAKEMLETNIDAIALKTDLESLCAAFELKAEEYARIALARSLLDRAIERFRDKHQGPILKEAGEIFRRLTCGSFARLEIDQTKSGELVLEGLRPSRETVAIAKMSDGAQDQLYLSLRLASLFDYFSRRPPIPFIVDDILVHFDDKRAAAALEVLAELSRKTQVVFFTHHVHLLELAAATLKPGSFVVHDLAQGNHPEPMESGAAS